jgi:pimeloyl-ACP methyl ester carboxylesterase
VPPETRYARSGGVHVAYQVTGEGPDLVLVPGWVSHVEYAWEDPSYSRFLRSLASFSRLILLDRRGTGLSDRVAVLPTLEERMDDVRAVMDAVGSKRAALFGISEGGPMCALFAATYPERTSALVLYGTFVKGMRDADVPWAPSPERVEEILGLIEREWGTGISLTLLGPSLAEDQRQREYWARFERLAVSPGAARLLMQTFVDTDVRQVLPTIRVPTLVVHRAGDQATPVEGGRYIAEHVSGARYVELPGEDHFAWTGDADAVLDAVEEFLTGARQARESDRVLATVLFTDIVGSTARAAALGDQRWRDLLASHHSVVRRELTHFRGREVKTVGDGFLATFDGPARGIRCACAVRDRIRGLGIDIRAGLHTGECELMEGDVGGIAVHIGARVAARAAAGEVLVSGTVKDLVAGSGLTFVDRGRHQLAGVPGEWPLFAVGPLSGTG